MLKPVVGLGKWQKHIADMVSLPTMVQGTYKQNTEDMLARNRGHKLVGTSIGTAKLTETQVLEIRSLASSLSMEKLAAKYGISDSGVWRIIHRETWKHI